MKIRAAARFFALDFKYPRLFKPAASSPALRYSGARAKGGAQILKAPCGSVRLSAHIVSHKISSKTAAHKARILL
jgi:hypothetical protein